MTILKCNFIWLSLLYVILGFDTLSIPAPLGNIRISIFLYFIVFVFLLIKGKIHFIKRDLVFILSISVFFLISTLYSNYEQRGLSYSINFILCFVLFYGVWRSIAKEIGFNGIINIIKYSGRIQIIIISFQFLILSINRPSFFYYEPSYAAIGLAPYIFLSIYYLIKYDCSVFKKIDFILVMCFVLITKSANALLCIILSFLFCFKTGGIKYKIYLFIIVSIFIVTLYFYSIYSDDLIAHTIRNIIHSDNPIHAILERTGNRWNRIIIAFDAIKYRFNFIFGIGPGSFSDYSRVFNPQIDYSNGMAWTDPRGYPAVNIFIELLVENGIFLLGIFLIFIFITIRKSSNKLISYCLIISLLLLCIESSIVRPYFWALVGFVSAFSIREKNEKNSNGLSCN